MSEYVVTWEIELDADSPEDAAERALAIQRDPDSFALMFYVEDLENGPPARQVDLMDKESEI